MSDEAEADAALVRQAAGGDPRAWRQLVDAHSGALFRYAFRLVGERDAAEDVVQETFLRLWRQARRWRPEAPVRAWLFRVAGNRAIDVLRRRRNLAELDPDQVQAGPGIEERLSELEQVRRVRQAIAALPDRQRQALVLCRLEGMSMAEAGRVLGCSVGAVESLLSRARSELRRGLEPAADAAVRPAALAVAG